MNNIRFLYLLIFNFSLCYANGQTSLSRTAWVDSVFNTMSLDQKIGQLFMIRAFSKNDALETQRIIASIDSFHIGGLCFFQGNPSRQVEMTNLYQHKSAVPLFIGIDGEWGLGMRFPESVMKFPKQLTLGAIADDSLIYKMGAAIAEQCHRLGIHFNFAPVVDVNNNAGNPVINERSFGEDKYIVTQKALAYMRGLQDNGMIATAKHFPGHGDTNADSHLTLPTLPHTVQRLHEVELFPFKAMINAGVESMMIGHLNIPQLDNRPLRSASLSKPIVTDLLREELGFNGLIITDAMEMKGITRHYASGYAEAEAFLAGVDIILMPNNLAEAFARIRNYIEEGKISPSRLEESVKRILADKYKVGLHTFMPMASSNVASVLNSSRYVALKNHLIAAAITLVADDNNTLPINLDGDKKLMSIGIGMNGSSVFHKRMDDFHLFDHFTLDKKIPNADKEAIIQRASSYEYAIVSLNDMSRSPDKNFGVTYESIDFIYALGQQTKVILVVFGNPYSLKYFDHLPCVVMAYEDDDHFQDIAAQMIFGVYDFNGRLPVSASSKYKVDAGMSKKKLDMLGFALPESVGMKSDVLNKIDALANDLISQKAAPGCVILVAKDSKIIYHKAFGNATYSDKIPLSKDKIYDVASLTKILSSTLALMHMYDDGYLDLNASLGQYIPEMMNTNKENLSIASILAHQAGLEPFIPFYQSTIQKKNKKISWKPGYYQKSPSKNYNNMVAPEMYVKNQMVDSIWQKIIQSPLKENSNYKYSDLGFLLLQKLIETQKQQPLDRFVYEHFYKPLQLIYTGYRPLDRWMPEAIAPSEKDDYWRMKTIQGSVHDMGAAMLGGVAGHAGLFSNAYEVAVIMQMLLNHGSYKERRFLSENSIAIFTKRYKDGTRRGLGFDMKELDVSKPINMSTLASNATFGHTGFTGTCAYADPKYNLVYVFLSNRTYPTMDNNLLHKKDYRTKIQDLIYQAIK